MTKRLVHFVVLIFLLSTSFLLAETETRLEFRTAAFIPSSHLFKKIYGNTGVDFQLQGAAGIGKNLEVWSNLDWFSKSGRSVGGHHRTIVRIANFSFGANFVYPLNSRYQFYIGAGPAFGGIWLKNMPPHHHEHSSKTVFGGFVKTGLYYTVVDMLYLDLFVDYLYQPVRFKSHVNIGGFKTGGGISVKF